MDVTPEKLYTLKGIQLFHFIALIYDTVHLNESIGEKCKRSCRGMLLR